MKKLIILLLLTFTAKAQADKFSAIPVKSKASFKFNTAIYFEYAPYTENYEDSVMVSTMNGDNIEAFLGQQNQAMFEANQDSVDNKLLLQSKLSVSNYTEKWEALKFRKVMAKDTSSYQILILKSSNEELIEDKESENAMLLSNILRLKSQVFSQFEYSEPSEKFKNLIPIAQQVKDLDGTLNLDKLGAYLKTKPNELEKYCDF